MYHMSPVFKLPLQEKTVIDSPEILHLLLIWNWALFISFHNNSIYETIVLGKCWWQCVAILFAVLTEPQNKAWWLQ